MSDSVVPGSGRPGDPPRRGIGVHGRPGADAWPSVLLAVLVALSAGCNGSPENSVNSIVFLTRDGCVNTVKVRARLDEALRRLDLGLDYRVIDLATLTAVDKRTGYGTPTILYGRRDIFGLPEPMAGRATPT